MLKVIVWSARTRLDLLWPLYIKFWAWISTAQVLFLPVNFRLETLFSYNIVQCFWHFLCTHCILLLYIKNFWLDLTVLTGVETEDLYRREGTQHADPQTDHVRDRGDGDGNRSVWHCVAHALRNRHCNRGTPPRSQHHERVINTNTCGKQVFVIFLIHFEIKIFILLCDVF